MLKGKKFDAFTLKHGTELYLRFTDFSCVV